MSKYWLGKKMSDEHKRKLSESHKGYIVLEETKKKISEKLKGKKKPKGFGFGHQVSEETKKKISESQKGKPRAYALGHKFNTGRKHTREWKQKMSERMKGNRHALGNRLSETSKEKIKQFQINNPNRKFKDTNIELKIEAELKRQGINYQKQVPLCNIAIVDFYLPEYRIVIECDGDYWHNREKTRIKDEEKTKVLLFNGFNVYRFWGHEINKSAEECINTLKVNNEEM